MIRALLVFIGIMGAHPAAKIVAQSPFSAVEATNHPTHEKSPKQTATIRIATFNIHELGREKIDQLDTQGRGANPQLKKAAQILQIARPDIVLVNEIDFDYGATANAPSGRNAQLFFDRYLAIGQGDQKSLHYPYIVFQPVNTGVLSGLDMNQDNRKDGPEDAFGYGKYPGQYGMALFSRFPIDRSGIRTFQKLLWKDMPGNLLPDGKEGRPGYYSQKQIEIFRLSSKSHWDVPISIEGSTIHMLCSHPTPPVFDGPEDRNGRRNHDEVRFWADYITGQEKASYIVDDQGLRGGLGSAVPFVLMGDLNAEPVRGDLVEGKRVTDLFLKHPRVQDPRPQSKGSIEAKGTNLPDYKPFRTHSFGRLDYVLPSKGLVVRNSGVFWPAIGDPHRSLIDEPDAASDHRLVWLDLQLDNIGGK